MTERARFVTLYEQGCFSMTELCARFQISRKTGYKWLARFAQAGLAGLQEQSRAPHSCPHRTAAALEAQLLALKRTHPHWGPKKIVAYLRDHHPALMAPAPSTVGELFRRHGLVQARPKRRPQSHPGSGPLETTAPNQVWCTDFKGDFRLGNGQRCFPLTLTDGHSRFLLACQSLPSTAGPEVQATFARAFQAYGLPEAIRSDNGIPFVSRAPLGLSRLSVWWLKLGIQHQRIQPGKPQQNGRHERMHRTLKAETARPPADAEPAQQQRFDQFQRTYNEERPHEALGQRPPASCYVPSPRPLPARLVGPDYPAYYEVRRVNAAGCLHFRQQHPFVSEVLTGEDLGLVEIAAGRWSLYFYEQLIGRFDEATGVVYG